MMNGIKRTSLSDEVADRLREKILRGKYSPGDKLPTETELMEMFQVSRSTLREAIRVLANAGWIRVQQGAGTFVEGKTIQNEPLYQRLQRSGEEDLEEVRSLLERKIVEKAALNHSKENIAKLKSILIKRAEYAKLGNAQACIDVDVEFHKHLAIASGNSILADLYEAFAIRLKESFLERFKTVESFEKTQQQHEELLYFIETGDVVNAIKSLDTIVTS